MKGLKIKKMINVLFDDRQNFLEITEQHCKTVEEAIAATLSSEHLKQDFEISVSFVSNKEIKELNKQYRNVDSETDVLSFPLDEDEFNGVVMLGDIVFSAEKIIEQAAEFGHGLDREIAYLTVHSTLHLLGYDHIDSDEKDEMRQKEKEIMKKLKIFK